MSGAVPILWLASWYPNRLDPFTGDFIQRHARAISSKRKVHVIFLRRDNSLPAGSLRIEARKGSMLSEDIAYYNCRGRLLSLFYYLAFYRKLVLAFLARHGKPPLVHVHVGLRAGLLALWLKRNYGIPYLVTEHWTGYHRAADRSIWKQGRFARWIAAAVFRNASVVMPDSHDLGRQIQVIEPQAKVRAVHNVVDTGLFYFQPKITGTAYTFVHASSLNAQKNPGLLLMAFQGLKHLENWRLVVAGPVSRHLRKMARTLQIDKRIEWLGEISYAEVATAMRSADCFVLSSRYENSPCVIGEALCCGVPVVSTNVGGISELIDINSGLLVESENVENLSSSLLRMYSGEFSWNREKIAFDAAAKFNYQQIAGEIENEYKRVLENAQNR